MAALTAAMTAFLLAQPALSVWFLPQWVAEAGRTSAPLLPSPRPVGSPPRDIELHITPAEITSVSRYSHQLVVPPWSPTREASRQQGLSGILQSSLQHRQSLWRDGVGVRTPHGRHLETEDGDIVGVEWLGADQPQLLPLEDIDWLPPSSLRRYIDTETSPLTSPRALRRAKRPVSRPPRYFTPELRVAATQSGSAQQRQFDVPAAPHHHNLGEHTAYSSPPQLFSQAGPTPYPASHYSPRQEPWQPSQVATLSRREGAVAPPFLVHLTATGYHPPVEVPHPPPTDLQMQRPPAHSPAEHTAALPAPLPYSQMSGAPTTLRHASLALPRRELSAPSSPAPLHTAARISSLPPHFQDPTDGGSRAPLTSPVHSIPRYFSVPVVTTRQALYAPDDDSYEPLQHLSQLSGGILKPMSSAPENALQRPRARPRYPIIARPMLPLYGPFRAEAENQPGSLTYPLRQRLPAAPGTRQPTLLTQPTQEPPQGNLWRQHAPLVTNGRLAMALPPGVSQQPLRANTPIAPIPALSSQPPPTRPATPPKQPPEPIQHSDLPKVTAGVVMTAAEGLTLPLTAAAAILDKFGSAMAVPFPSMGAAIGRAAGVLEGAAESANRMAPTMAPLLADTLEEVWKQAAKTDASASTSVSRWVDFSNGVNVFKTERDAEKGAGVKSQHEAQDVNNADGGDGAKGRDVSPDDEGKIDERTEEKDNAQDEENQEATNGDQEQAAAMQGASDSNRWGAIDWTQLLLGRRRAAVAGGLTARSGPVAQKC